MNAPAPRHTDLRADRVVRLFEALQPSDLPGLGQLYAADARFKDPFNEVTGVPAIRAVFEHMYVALESPRFVVHDVLVDGDQCFLTWDFLFRMRRLNRADQCVRGGSHLRFAPDGRIAEHRDYWDVAEELYEKLPLVGGLMRWLKTRASS